MINRALEAAALKPLCCVGTRWFTDSLYSMSDTELFEQSFNIAWSVLQRTGELGEPNDTSRFLLDNITGMMRRGERRRLLLSNPQSMPIGDARLGSSND
jgi:hypothetical protein